jgi:hypothetical protein
MAPGRRILQSRKTGCSSPKLQTPALTRISLLTSDRNLRPCFLGKTVKTAGLSTSAQHTKHRSSQPSRSGWYAKPGLTKVPVGLVNQDSADSPLVRLLATSAQVVGWNSFDLLSPRVQSQPIKRSCWKQFQINVESARIGLYRWKQVRWRVLSSTSLPTSIISSLDFFEIANIGRNGRNRLANVSFLKQARPIRFGR